MARKTISAKQAAVAVLSRAGKPMPVKDVAAEVLAMPGVKLGGKTPAATIAAILYTAPEFKKAGRGVVKLAKGAKDTKAEFPRLAQRRPKAKKPEPEVRA